MELAIGIFDQLVCLRYIDCVEEGSIRARMTSNYAAFSRSAGKIRANLG